MGRLQSQLMDSPAQPQSTLDTLRSVEFRLGLKGYNVDEVDEYLEKAAVEADALNEQLRQATERLRQASERIAQLEESRQEAAPQIVQADPIADETLQRTLLLAQKFVDQTKRESESEATEIVSRAEELARSTIAQAEERARQLTTDAERRLRDEVTRLEAMRAQLASDVENMARHLEAERNRLRGALGDILKWVEDNVQPANSLMAMRSKSGASDASRGLTTGGAPAPSSGTSRPAPASPASNPSTTAVTDVTSTHTPDPRADSATQVLDLRGGGSGVPGSGPGS